MKFSGFKHNPIFGNHCCAIITLSISRTFSTSQNKLTVYKPRSPTLCFCLFAYLFVQFVGFCFKGFCFLVLYFLQWGALNKTSTELQCLDFLLYIYTHPGHFILSNRFTTTYTLIISKSIPVDETSLLRLRQIRVDFTSQF